MHWLRWNGEAILGRNLGCKCRETLSLWKTVKDWSATSSLTHHAEVTATKKITFMERWAREQVASGLKDGLVRAERMRFRSQEGVDVRMDRKVLRRPQRKWSVVP